MEQSKIPRMMTIRQVAQQGVLSEYTLRLLEKQNRLPCIYTGRRCLVNYNRLVELLNTLDENQNTLTSRGA